MARDPTDLRASRTMLRPTQAVPAKLPQPELTVVVPAYNEAERLPATLDQLGQFLDQWGIDYRVLVVDDGSKDGTPKITNRYGTRFSTVSLPHNRGKGAAVREGMRRAKGRVVCFMDADLPYALDCLRQGYETIVAGRAEVVFGARDVAGAACRVRRRWLRSSASLVFRGIVKCLISRRVSDTQAGFKMFSSEACRQIFSLATIDSFAFDTEVVYLTHQLRLSYQRQGVVLINERASSLSLMRHTLPMIRDVFRVRWQAWQGTYYVAEMLRMPAPANPSDRKAA